MAAVREDHGKSRRRQMGVRRLWCMPARKRHRRQPEHPDPIVRFGKAVKETEARDKAERSRVEAEKREAARRRKEAAEHAARLKSARRKLDRAIAEAKAARASGKGVAEADERWRDAKAVVIELETGAPPPWAPANETDPDEAADGDQPTVEAGDESADEVHEEIPDPENEPR